MGDYAAIALTLLLQVGFLDLLGPLGTLWSLHPTGMQRHWVSFGAWSSGVGELSVKNWDGFEQPSVPHWAHQRQPTQLWDGTHISTQKRGARRP